MTRRGLTIPNSVPPAFSQQDTVSVNNEAPNSQNSPGDDSMAV